MDGDPQKINNVPARLARDCARQWHHPTTGIVHLQPRGMHDLAGAVAPYDALQNSDGLLLVQLAVSGDNSVWPTL